MQLLIIGGTGNIDTTMTKRSMKSTTWLFSTERHILRLLAV